MYAEPWETVSETLRSASGGKEGTQRAWHRLKMLRFKWKLSTAFYSLLSLHQLNQVYMLLIISSKVGVGGNRGWGAFQTHRQFSMASWASYPSGQPWLYPPGNSRRSHRLGVQSYKTARPPLPASSSKSSLFLCFWPTGCRSRVPTTPSLGSVNSLE